MFSSGGQQVFVLAAQKLVTSEPKLALAFSRAAKFRSQFRGLPESMNRNYLIPAIREALSGFDPEFDHSNSSIPPDLLLDEGVVDEDLFISAANEVPEASIARLYLVCSIHEADPQYHNQVLAMLTAALARYTAGYREHLVPDIG